ncbi:MAG: hypothetical protein GEV03_11470 [Streptosporangiales bacterium]|nr:hypothetical protein [Streptosporangiales bacterium]
MDDLEGQASIATATHGQLTDGLLVQATARDLDVLRLADRDGSGLVFSGEGAIAAARAARRRGFDRPVLVDRRRYAGNSRVRGTAPLSSRWLADQRDLGVTAVLTDSGYIGACDEEALTSVLGGAASASAAGEAVTAVLPLHMRWLRGDLKKLIYEVLRHEVPVALVLEHPKDPLGTRVAVAGLIELLRTPAPVSLLSSDVSSLGAIAFGARWAAVGMRTNLRHLYPKTDSDRGWHPSGAHSALVDPVLSIVTVDKIFAAWAATPDAPVWRCPCPTCHGRTLDWLQTASEVEVNAHTFELLMRRRDDLVRVEPGRLREQSWREACRHALYRYEELGLEGLGWDPPGFLKAWTSG